MDGIHMDQTKTFVPWFPVFVQGKTENGSGTWEGCVWYSISSFRDFPHFEVWLPEPKPCPCLWFALMCFSQMQNCVEVLLEGGWDSSGHFPGYSHLVALYVSRGGQAQMVPQIQVCNFFDFFGFKYLSESFSAAADLRDLFSWGSDIF